MLRHEASVLSVADASYLSMTAYSRLLQKKGFPLLSGLVGRDFRSLKRSTALGNFGSL
jgi:hypothetical protein